ncbi:MAG: carbon-phosphorus lyase complex subunit PhnI [Pseudomonadota bacterium]
MYVAVKGGERAIRAAHDLLAEERRGDEAIPVLGIAQIREQMSLAVARVMAEGALYDPDLAALAIKQAQGDLVEAVFLLRAYRTTLPRFGQTKPVDTGAMALRRRISAAFKDIPGGQILGPTYDYTHRLLDFSLLDDDHTRGSRLSSSPNADLGQSDGPERHPTQSDFTEHDLDGRDLVSNRPEQDAVTTSTAPRVTDILGHEGLLEPSPADTGATPFDITREPMTFPADRDQRLQNLARGDEGFLLAMGYSTQRGFGGNHPFAGEIRLGEVAVSIAPDELGFDIELGTIELTECQMVNQFKGSETAAPQFTRGYGLAFGHNERKAMAMALVDRALRAKELGEEVAYPAQDEEFVMYHSDNVEASGFVQHLKLPHYVDFQSELELLRKIRVAWRDAEETPSPSARTATNTGDQTSEA